MNLIVGRLECSANGYDHTKNQDNNYTLFNYTILQIQCAHCCPASAPAALRPAAPCTRCQILNFNELSNLWLRSIFETL